MKDLKERILEILGEFQDGASTDETITEIESLIKENYVEKHNLTDDEIEMEARQYAIHHSNAPDKDCPEWESGAKWARMKTIGVIQDLTEIKHIDGK